MAATFPGVVCNQLLQIADNLEQYEKIVGPVGSVMGLIPLGQTMASPMHREVAAQMLKEKDRTIRVLAERIKGKTEYSGPVENIIASAGLEAATRK